MAGLLKPAAAKLLVGAIRKEFPHLPIHVHTHGNLGVGGGGHACPYAHPLSAAVHSRPLDRYDWLVLAREKIRP